VALTFVVTTTTVGADLQAQVLAIAGASAASARVPSSDPASLKRLLDAPLIVVATVGTPTVRQVTGGGEWLRVPLSIAKEGIFKGTADHPVILELQQPFSAPVTVGERLLLFLQPCSVDRNGHVLTWENVTDAGYFRLRIQDELFLGETIPVIMAENLLGNDRLFRKGIWDIAPRHSVELRLPELIRSRLGPIQIPPALLATKVEWILTQGDRDDSRGALPLDLILAAIQVRFPRPPAL
jgi:hypothetical protein